MIITMRLAHLDDVPGLRTLIEASVRGLQARDYTPLEIEGALATVFGVDTQLIADRTYFVAEAAEAGAPLGGVAAGTGSALASRPMATDRVDTDAVIVGCGGWSKRATLFRGDHWTKREDALLDPALDAAKIRGFFVHPDWARCGVGSAILATCEQAAVAAGFTRLEMGATLTGVPLYAARGYKARERFNVPLNNGATLPIVRMTKTVRGASKMGIMHPSS